MFVPSHPLLSVAPQTQAPSKPVVILQPHSHRLLLAGSILANVVMGGLIVGFFTKEFPVWRSLRPQSP